MVSISACHAEDPGSIPGLRGIRDIAQATIPHIHTQGLTTNFSM